MYGCIEIDGIANAAGVVIHQATATWPIEEDRGRYWIAKAPGHSLEYLYPDGRFRFGAHWYESLAEVQSALANLQASANGLNASYRSRGMGWDEAYEVRRLLMLHLPKDTKVHVSCADMGRTTLVGIHRGRSVTYCCTPLDAFTAAYTD